MSKPEVKTLLLLMARARNECNLKEFLVEMMEFGESNQLEFDSAVTFAVGVSNYWLGQLQFEDSVGPNKIAEC